MTHTETNIPQAIQFADVVLKDDSTPYGGISFIGETLKDFMDEINEPLATPMNKVNEWLNECGICKIEY